MLRDAFNDNVATETRGCSRYMDYAIIARR
jgi:hypothetical protein